jgi:Ca2+-dependent lipid-binding protein
VIELKVVAARSLPKSSFRTPNAWARVVVYGTNQFDSPMRLFDLKTELSQKSQNAVWNKSLPVKLRNSLKMIDVELYDRVAGIDKELSRVRLKMSYIQGVEANFASRSLIYGIDGKSSKFGFGTTANRC